MKNIYLSLIVYLYLTTAHANQEIISIVEIALKNNPKINAERQNLSSIKQNINISKGDFLPSLTLSQSQTSTSTSEIIDQSGSSSGDTKRNTETKKLSVEQDLFQGFKSYNNLKKSRLEFEKANFEYKQVEQEIILKSITSYFDLIFKNKSKNFNLLNVDLFERQVESDKARLQKGEITLTDLAQSESSLAGANAKFIKAETELIASVAEFERINRVPAPENFIDNLSIKISTPSSLKKALELTLKNNPSLEIARINYLISEKELKIEKAKLSPSASLNYSITENEDLSSTIDKDEQETVKATITWPIIKGGKNLSGIKKFKHKKEKNKLLLLDKENEVKTQTAKAWSFFQSSESILDSTASQLKAAEIANEGITLEYDSGNTRTTLELIQSRSLLLNARISHAESQKDFIVSKLELLRQLGILSLNSIN